MIYQNLKKCHYTEKFQWPGFPKIFLISYTTYSAHELTIFSTFNL